MIRTLGTHDGTSEGVDGMAYSGVASRRGILAIQKLLVPASAASSCRGLQHIPKCGGLSRAGEVLITLNSGQTFARRLESTTAFGAHSLGFPAQLCLKDSLEQPLCWLYAMWAVEPYYPSVFALTP